MARSDMDVSQAIPRGKYCLWGKSPFRCDVRRLIRALATYKATEGVTKPVIKTRIRGNRFREGVAGIRF